MAKGIKGIIVEIGGDTSGLQKALEKVNSSTSSLSKELRGVNSLLKLDPSNTELLVQKQTLLTKSIDETSEKLKLLQEVQAKADEAIANGTEISEENYRNIQREIISTQNKLNGLTEDLKQFNSQLVSQNSKWTKATQKADEYGNKLKEVSKKASDLGNKMAVASAGVVAGGTILANTAMGLEDAVAKYVSSTNIAKNETEKYKQVLEDINAGGYGEGYEDIANSMSAVTMQLKDLDSQELKNITEKVIALRDLFGYEVSESVRAVKALMDNFNISADEAFNLISEGKKQGLDFSNELLDNVNEYSVQFNKLGLTAEDMFNIFKTGADNGAFNLDKIGDAVKEFSIRTIDGSNTTIDGFKRIGLNADEMAEKFAKGGDVAKEAFIEVVRRLGNMDDEVSQSIAGVDLFGTMWEDLGPTVVTSFSKMDNGISKNSDSMQKSIDELYNTTKKKAERQLKRLQSLGADFGEEMLPVLEDLIDMVEKFVESLEGMSDEEKRNIVNIGLLVAAAGPLTKIFGSITGLLGGAAKGLGTFGQAVDVIKGKTTSTVPSVNSLAGALTKLTSPLGLLVTAFSGVTTAAALYEKHQQELLGNSVETKKAIEEEVKTRKELIQTQSNNINSNIAEINKSQELFNELQKITDENGNIKKGYESRANYIINQLSEALGIEIDLNDGVIDSYKKIQKEIDKTILKKKAEAIVNSQEDAYNNALSKRADAYRTLNDLQTKYNDAMQKAGDFDLEARQAAGALQQQIKEQQQLIQGYNEDIAKYDKNNSLLLENTTESLNQLIRNNEVGISKLTDDTYNGVTSQITYYSQLVTDYSRLKNEQLQVGNEYNAQAYEQQEESNRKQLEQLAEQLSQITTTTNINEPAIQEAWRNIAANSSTAFFNIVSKMPPDMQTKLIEIAGVVNNDIATRGSMQGLAIDLKDSYNVGISGTVPGTKKNLKAISKAINRDKSVEESMQELAKDADEGFNNNVNGSEWGSDLTKEMSNGMTSNQSKSWITSAVETVSGWISDFLHFTVPEKGPLSDMDKSMPDMIDLMARGILQNKGRLLNATEKMAQELKDKLMLDNTANISSLAKMQGSVMSKTIDKTKTIFTTPQIVFNVQELDEAKLQQCFNYINRKFGSQY